MPNKCCERCGKFPDKIWNLELGEYMHTCFDYCAECSKDLCTECMKKGCCGNVPAKSGDADDNGSYG